MIEVPGRISELINRIESGDIPSAEELRRVAMLQALDLAKAGEDFVREMSLRDDQHTKDFANA